MPANVQPILVAERVPKGKQLCSCLTLLINAFNSRGQDQRRKRPRIMDTSTLRLVMAAARTLWFIDPVECGTGLQLKRHPGPVGTCLQAAGVDPAVLTVWQELVAQEL